MKSIYSQRVELYQQMSAARIRNTEEIHKIYCNFASQRADLRKSFVRCKEEINATFNGKVLDLKEQKLELQLKRNKAYLSIPADISLVNDLDRKMFNISQDILKVNEAKEKALNEEVSHLKDTLAEININERNEIIALQKNFEVVKKEITDQIAQLHRTLENYESYRNSR